jgi:succinoglycan biosynthesis transport protein ExoP
MSRSIAKSTAKVMIRPGRAEVQVSSGEQREITLPVSATTEQVNSEIEIIKSAELARQVVERMTAAGTPIFGADTALSIDKQVGILRSMLSVGPTPQSNVIAVEMFARNAKKGQQILETLVDTYLDRHAQVHRASGATAFFDRELMLQRERVHKAEVVLADFVERERIVIPEDQIRWAVKDAVRFRDVLRTQSNKISVAERNLAIMRKQLADQPERVFADAERVNPEAQLLTTKLGELEAQRANAKQLYTDEDRTVSDIDGEIAILKGRLALAKASSGIPGRERMSANPIREVLTQEILHHERNLYDLQERVKALPGFLDNWRSQNEETAVALRKKTIELASLEQDVSAAREAYRLFERKQDEARISEALDKEGIVNVSVLDPASLAVKPFNQMSMVMVFAALIAGIGLGVGSAVGVEFLGRNFKLEEQVEQYLELPVFAVIPDISEIAELPRS